ncbi:MAG: aminotransferase class V-fold PLP-dependent enzyme [Candidatus Omnitrophica bacterium]|nr:aminotransferase class V-fold PLP-dependent enzyme [Candidatus Omnitrophota bacterium]
MKIETLAVHAANEPDPDTGAVAAPIHMSTTYLRAGDGSYPGGYVYGRSENPNRAALETALAQLEGGAGAAAFASGLAAIHAIFQALQPGDHAVVSQDIYHGTQAMLEKVMLRWGLDISFISFDDLNNVRAALHKDTRLVYLETPTNPMMKIIDLAEVITLAHNAGAKVVVDNTLATPVLQRPLGLGADISVHSSTKYFGGHSDVTGGAVIVKSTDEFFARIREEQSLAGAVPSPFDCWLIRRGLATLPLRVGAQAANALRIAEFLSAHPGVNCVHYPGLPDHPGHAIARKQMSPLTPGPSPASGRGGNASKFPGSLPLGAMLSFQVAAGEAAARKVASTTKLFTQATSLGSVESLIEHRASVAGESASTPRDLLRLSVGIEAAEDLIVDLDQALNSV